MLVNQHNTIITENKHLWTEIIKNNDLNNQKVEKKFTNYLPYSENKPIANDFFSQSNLLKDKEEKNEFNEANEAKGVL